MKQKNIRAAVCLLLSATLLSACAPQALPEPVRITLMHGWGGSAPDHVAMRAIYADFATQNPDLLVEFISYPDSSIALEKASDMLSVGEMPSMVSTNGNRDFVQGAVRRGMALDLAPYLEADAELAASVSEAARSAWQTPEGKLYTLSDAQEISGYWYNEDILRQAGVTQDGTAQSPVRLPTTTLEFWAAWDAVAAWSEAQQNDVTPAALSGFQVRSLLGALIASGGPEGVAFMQGTAARCPKALLTTALEGVVHAYTVADQQLVSENNARQLFFEGRTAFFLGGVWSNTELAKTEREQNIQCTAYPDAQGQGIAYVTPSSGYVVSAAGDAKQTQACIRFLTYITSEQTQRRIAAESRQAPSSPQVDTDWITQQVPVLGQALQACYEAPIHILAFPTLLGEPANRTLDAWLAHPQLSEATLSALYLILTES